MKRIDEFDWPVLETELDVQGQVMLPGILSPDECDALAGLSSEPSEFRETISLEVIGLGTGELRYFKEVLPAPLQDLRDALYRKLVPIANRWSEAPRLEGRYPGHFDDFVQACRQSGQQRRQSALSRLREGDHLALHQNAAAERVFPLQVAMLLSEPGLGFFGGELALIEQRPRVQSRPMVVPLRRGDAAIFAVRYRPYRGTKRFYRVNLKHAVSRVRSGERLGVELLFHSAR